MSSTFEPLKLADTTLFGVRVRGPLGRRDRQRLFEIVERCLARGKSKVALDLGAASALAGGTVAILGDLHRLLCDRGGGLLLIGAGEGVRRALAKRYGADGPTCADSVADLGTTPPPADTSLDGLLEGIVASEGTSADARRLTADLVTAAYLPVEEALVALRSTDNPMAMGEALGNLLYSQDLAAQTLYLARSGDEFVAVDGSCRLPAAGSVARTLADTDRPLTLLDLEDGLMGPQELAALEALEPDLLLPVRWNGALQGIAVLRRGKDDPEYGLAEIFALQLLLRQMSAERDALQLPSSPPAADPLVQIKLGLVRELARAQDVPHFWQVFQGRIQEVARIHSLVCVDSDPGAEPFLAGTARTRPLAAHLEGERIRAFFRTLERPVEIRNMPQSLAPIRDALLDLELDWVVGLNIDGRSLGAAMLGLRWHAAEADVQAQLQEIMEVAIERLDGVRETQRRFELGLHLVEALTARAEALAGNDDQITPLIAENVRSLSRGMGLPPEQERDLVLGALLRDFGQTADPPPPDIDGRTLEGQVWEEYRAHPDTGADQLRDLQAPAGICDAVRHHHERYDGAGFPHALSGRNIPLPARMVAVVQTFVHALVTTGNSVTAFATLKSAAGAALDPDLVEIFSKVARRDTPVVRREPVCA